MTPGSVEHRLLNDFQRDFPLEPRPFAAIGQSLGLDERDVIDRLKDLKSNGSISRVGAAVRPGTVGASTLAAIRVPETRLEEVADIVTAFPEVNHNYEREHDVNLWFVVTAPDETALIGVLDAISEETGLEVMDLRLLTPFHIDLGFDLK